MGVGLVWNWARLGRRSRGPGRQLIEVKRCPVCNARINALHFLRRDLHERGDVFGQPNDFAAISVVESFEAA